MKIGMSLPRFRVPARLGDALVYLSSERLKQRPCIVTFVHPLDAGEVSLLLEQANLLRRDAPEVLLLAVGDVDPLHTLPPIWLPPDVILLADPVGRLHWAFGVQRSGPTGRCETFVFESNGTLQFRAVHDLTGLGLNAFGEILKASQMQSATAAFQA